jgi:hypothetical protein
MMTVAERTVLAAKGVTGVRLSCQIICDHDMTVRAVSRLAGSGRPDPGARRARDHSAARVDPKRASRRQLLAKSLYRRSQGGAGGLYVLLLLGSSNKLG